MPEMVVRALTADREEDFFKFCHQGGEPHPEVYAASVFMALTPFDAYKCWGKSLNWSGSNGKQALPESLKEWLHQQVCQRFPNLSGEQWWKIRNKINDRLRSPHKVDPETQRVGYLR